MHQACQKMTPKRKRQLSFVTIGLFFLLQGVEYAVILPTLWLYIENNFHAPSYFLGLVLSAYSFAGLIAAPLMGRWSDRTSNTKMILLIANWFQVAGSLMYFMGLSVWFLVGARLVAGLGSGVGAAFFADITRVTTREERTAVMSTFMAVRQLGLLAGPGCNLFLRECNFYIGPFIVDKYTAPGVFMALMWVIHEVLAVFMYWNLPQLKLQEELEKQQLGHSVSVYGGDPPSLPPVASDSFQNEARQASARVAQEAAVPPVSVSRGRGSSKDKPLLSSSDFESSGENFTSSNEMIETAEQYMGPSPGGSRGLPSPNQEHTANGRQLNVPDPPPGGSAYLSLSEGQSSHQYSNNAPHETADQNSASEQAVLTTTQRVSNPAPASRHLDYGALGDADSMQRCEAQEVDPLLQPSESLASIQDPSVATGPRKGTVITRKYLAQEFLREEIIVILFTTFVAFFNQVGMETLCTPLTKKLLGWEELENSIMYSAAGVEVIAVFFLIRWLSRHLSDRWLLLIGFVIETVTVAFSTWFLPQASPAGTGGSGENLAGLVILVFLDVFGLPFLAVSSASLFSKLTREETQGFAQGLRRVSVGSGTILGPLWSGSLLHNLLINCLVSTVINIIAMVMLLLSFKHLKEPQHQAAAPAGNHGNIQNHPPTVPSRRPTSETSPLLSGAGSP